MSDQHCASCDAPVSKGEFCLVCRPWIRDLGNFDPLGGWASRLPECPGSTHAKLVGMMDHAAITGESRRPPRKLKEWFQLLIQLGIPDERLIQLADVIDRGDCDAPALDEIRRSLDVIPDHTEIEGFRSIEAPFGTITIGETLANGENGYDGHHLHCIEGTVSLDGIEVPTNCLTILAEVIQDECAQSSDEHPALRLDALHEMMAEMGLRFTEFVPGAVEFLTCAPCRVASMVEEWEIHTVATAPTLWEILYDAFDGKFGETVELKVKALISHWWWPANRTWRYRDDRDWVDVETLAWNKSFQLLGSIIEQYPHNISLQRSGIKIMIHGNTYHIRPATASRPGPHNEPYRFSKTGPSGKKSENICIHSEQSRLPLGDILASLVLYAMQDGGVHHVVQGPALRLMEA